MADNTQQQAQTLTLDNGNAAQNQYLSYYNQLISQLGGNNANTVSSNAITQVPQAQAQLMQNPTQLQAQQIQSPGQLTWNNVAAPQSLSAQYINAPTVTAQQIAAANTITPGTINVEEQTQEDLARQVSAYLRPYTENAINARRAQTGKDRAAADVDAASRGMGSSTWLSDAKNRMAAAEASDITAMENEYLGNLGQQVFNSYQNYLNRAFQANMQNVANDLAAQQANASNALAVNQFNANALMNADQYNAGMAYNAAAQNAANQMAADQYNSQMAYNAAMANAQGQMQADQYNLNTLLAIAQQNAANQMAADQFNIGNAMSVDQYNANVLNDMNQYNISNLLAIAQDNAANQLKADMYNSDLYTQLMQLAMGYAGNLSGMVDLGGGGGGGGGGGDVTSPGGMTFSEMLGKGTDAITQAQNKQTADANAAIASAMDAIAQQAAMAQMLNNSGLKTTPNTVVTSYTAPAKKTGNGGR